MIRTALALAAMLAVCVRGQAARTPEPEPAPGSAARGPIDGETAMPGPAADNFIGRCPAASPGPVQIPMPATVPPPEPTG